MKGIMGVRAQRVVPQKQNGSDELINKTHIESEAVTARIVSNKMYTEKTKHRLLNATKKRL